MTAPATAPSTFAPDLLAEAREIMSEARIIFRVRGAYIAPILVKAGCVWAPCGTAGVNAGNRLFFDPRCAIKFARAEGVEVIAGVLAHECLHIMLKDVHHRGDRCPRRWNIACDLRINGMLVAAGWELPSCGIFPDTGSAKYPATTFTGADGSQVKITHDPKMSAAEIYDLLPEDPTATDENGEPRKSDGEPQPCSGECGEGAGGEKMEGEPETGSTDAHGSEISEVTDSEMESARDACAREIAKDSAGKKPGSLSGSLSVWADGRLAPPVTSWFAILRRETGAVVRRAAGGRKTYRRPHRRQACMGSHPRNPIRATYESEKARVWYAVDTSGSMGPENHAHAVGNLLAVAGAAAEVYVLACDTKIQGEPVKLPRSRSAALAMVRDMLTGGGGTNFVPIFEKAESAKGKTRPDLVIVATDGGGPAPSKAPSVPTIWLITPGCKAPVSWGKEINIPR